MDVTQFGLFSVDDPADLRFTCDMCWSRIYEYPYVLSQIQGSAIHNTSWGFEGIHIVFKTWLDSLYPNVVHSDLRGSSLTGTHIWDLTTLPPPEWVNRFDTVLCISTLEHVTADHVQIIRDHLLPQLTSGGRLIVTFDLPGLQLESLERFLGQPIRIPDRPLTPHTSAEPDRLLGLSDGTRVGYLTVTL